MRILLDTNILLRMVDPANSQHSLAVDAVERLREEGYEICVVPQNIYEFWVVATRPIDVNGLGMTQVEASLEITGFLRLFTFLRDERSIFEQWQRLVAVHAVIGVKAHDTRLAAVMVRHQLSHVLTFDPGVFSRFPQIKVLAPNQIAAGK